MVEAAIKSCNDTLAELQEKHDSTAAKAQSQKIIETRGKLNLNQTPWFKTENDNHEVQANFSDFIYELKFHGIKIATLKNWDFKVDKNNSKIFVYDVKSESIPLNPDLMEIVDLSMTRDKIMFDLKGHTRARWKVGPIKSVNFWLIMSCDLQFHMDGSSIDFHSCSSKHK